MRVLMFGWEFAPIYSGGLGVACAGLVKAMVEKGAEVTFVIPKNPNNVKVKGVNLISAEEGVAGKITIKEIPCIAQPYQTCQEYQETYKLWKKKNPNASPLYGQNLFAEVMRFAEAAKQIAKEIPHDVIHAHDWMTYMAGANAKKVSGKPLVVHIHATEFDRTGGNGINQDVYDIEKFGFKAADKVLAVSNFTREKVISNYGIPEEKVQTAHNAIEFVEPPREHSFISKKDRIVLFLGRVTLQKGPDWFLAAAKKVLEIDPNIKFVVAGSGDMSHAMIEKAADMGIAKNVLFTGWLNPKTADKVYKMAMVYVMPSVSEPFGLTPLEAMRNGTPVIISKQSGVSEVIQHCLKVDFWDTHELANKILGVVYHKELQEELSIHGTEEVHTFSWGKTAEDVLSLYGKLRRRKRR